MELLFRTVHGSKLYGLNRPGSDSDYYEVYANEVPSPPKFIKQTIKGGLDVVRMNLSTFMLYASRSSHQSLEAMFSPFAEVDKIKELRLSYRVNSTTLVQRYTSTIHSFARKDDLKSKRHAVRLCFNLHDALEHGRFNPVMTGKRKQFLLDADAEHLDEMVEELVLGSLPAVIH